MTLFRNQKFEGAAPEDLLLEDLAWIAALREMPAEDRALARAELARRKRHRRLLQKAMGPSVG